MQIRGAQPFTNVAVTFGAKIVTDQKQLSKLRDQLVEQLPGGPFEYSNGSGIGFISYPKDKRIGIKIYSETEANKQFIINDLLNRKVITPEPQGAYLYKNALVGFEAVGRIVAQ